MMNDPKDITPDDVTAGCKSVNAYRAQTGVTDPAYCTTAPQPGTFLTPAALAASCRDCGHAVLAHIGTTHCPICELIDLNRHSRALVQSGRVEVAVQGRPLDRKLLREIVERQSFRNGSRYLR